MGDFNAKVGEQIMDDVVGPPGLGQKNERGERLVEWAQRNEVIIGNTWFEQSPRRKWTWKSPGDGSRNQIDFILISKRFRNAPLISKTLSSADCYSDHVLLMGKIRVKLRKRKKTKPNIRLNLDLLTSDTDLCQKYNLKVKNKFEAFEEINEVEELWQQLKRSITEAAKEEIPTKERKTKQKWMTEDILNLVDKR
ncbi:endonuclease-reverse transcriptase [Elysia marginata]|uniref:Endonuclease-reverse transcriptase n=1 Tax=Elysia marginata TaxID=1093978 RepID=A0AAV4I8K2_9GAST|nr:endonuclease-reverse transcriptase [Elysia marginata]